jgi:hypothetical protein
LTKQQARLAALQNQVKRLDARLSKLNRASNRYSWVRLGVFVGGATLAIGTYYAAGTGLFWLVGAVSVAAFGGVVRYHRQIDRTIARYTIWRGLKATEIARIRLDWPHIPKSKRIEPQPDHPFETDLDIAGERSVHQLIDTATSYGGSQRLRAWLTNPLPDPALIVQRQALVRELIPATPFRDKLSMNALLGSDNPNERWDGDRLLAWFEQHTAARSLRRPLSVLAALAAVNAVLFVLNNAALIPAVWIASFLLYWAVTFSTLRNTGDVFEDAASLNDALNKLRAVFRFLETYPYTNRPALRKVCAPFLDAAHRPSVQLRRLTQIMAAASVAHNPLFWLLFNSLVPWDVFFAHQLSRAKAELKAFLPVWLDVWYELEALSALATFGCLNPQYTFPEVADGNAPFVFKGQMLGHPLIPADRRVCNDFGLDRRGEVAIITGSNMAGKSSFLRTLGVNLCLAYAGGPVCAQRFETSLFRLFSCIRVNDSVIDGFSYFYAEVRRLRALLDALEEEHVYPLFFLIDEIFRGTNNRERLVGSRAYIRALVGRNGTGVIATHDLELVKLEQDIPQIRNFHFREEVVEGRMVFDYKLRPGPCPTTNALKIMQMEGLPVDVPQPVG